jgi:hypothetical protein
MDLYRLPNHNPRHVFSTHIEYDSKYRFDFRIKNYQNKRASSEVLVWLVSTETGVDENDSGVRYR